MPVPKKKDTTAEAPSEVPDFHEHLRALIRSATRVVMEEVMREELDQFIGAGWGECSPQRKGYRNGTYTRDLTTASGPIEELKVPRDRAGAFHTHAFERYSRYEPAIAEGLTKMDVAWHEYPQSRRSGTNPDGKRSECQHNQSFESDAHPTMRKRGANGLCKPIGGSSTWMAFISRSEMREKCDTSIILTALGVDVEGNKEGLARACLCGGGQRRVAERDSHDLRRRGATQLDLIVTDGHDGLLAAVSELFSATPRKPCLVHKQRNVMNAIPRREREAVQGELTGIWKQEKKEDALANLVAFKAKYAQRYPEAVRSLFEDEDHRLPFYAFPPTMYRHIQTTNAIEGFFEPRATAHRSD